MRITLLLSLVTLVGCASESMEKPTHHPAPVDAGAPAAVSLPVADSTDHPIRSLVGGQLGVGGGFLVGARVGLKSREDAVQASQRAEKTPAKPEDVDRVGSADLNEDGFVTLDEIVAMFKANLSNQEMIDRLRATKQVFELTEFHDDFLRTRGISDEVIRAIHGMKPKDDALTASARQRH